MVPESTSVLLNKALVMCRDARRGFDTWPERLEAIEKLVVRLTTLAASGPPSDKDLGSVYADLKALGIEAPSEACSSLSFLDHGSLREAFVEDLDFEATKALEVRKQRRWLSNK